MAIDETIITHCEECGEYLGGEAIAEVYPRSPEVAAVFPVGMIIHASCFNDDRHTIA